MDHTENTTQRKYASIDDAKQSYYVALRSLAAIINRATPPDRGQDIHDKFSFEKTYELTWVN